MGRPACRPCQRASTAQEAPAELSDVPRLDSEACGHRMPAVTGEQVGLRSNRLGDV